MTKFTSGPWYYQDWTDQPSINDMPIIVGSRVGEIAQLHDHPGVPFEIAQANARLMAKAPEMFELLQIITGPADNAEWIRATNQAVVLIAEIEGES